MSGTEEFLPGSPFPGVIGRTIALSSPPASRSQCPAG